MWLLIDYQILHILCLFCIVQSLFYSIGILWWCIKVIWDAKINRLWSRSNFHKLLLEGAISFAGHKLQLLIIISPQMGWQTEVVNRTLEMYPRCFTSDKPKEWSRWISWAELSWNTSAHMQQERRIWNCVQTSITNPTFLCFWNSSIWSVDQELSEGAWWGPQGVTQLRAVQDPVNKVYDVHWAHWNFEEGNLCLLASIQIGINAS